MIPPTSVVMPVGNGGGSRIGSWPSVARAPAVAELSRISVFGCFGPEAACSSLGAAADEAAGFTATGDSTLSPSESLGTEVPFGSLFWFCVGPCAGEAPGGSGCAVVGVDWGHDGFGEISTSSPIKENPARRISLGSTRPKLVGCQQQLRRQPSANRLASPTQSRKRPSKTGRATAGRKEPLAEPG